MGCNQHRQIFTKSIFYIIESNAEIQPLVKNTTLSARFWIKSDQIYHKEYIDDSDYSHFVSSVAIYNLKKCFYHHIYSNVGSDGAFHSREYFSQ